MNQFSILSIELALLLIVGAVFLVIAIARVGFMWWA